MENTMWTCKHCRQTFTDLTTSQKANHSRWCDLNPKKVSYLNTLQNTRSNHTAESRKKQGESVKQCWKDGRFNREKPFVQTFFKHTEETKQQIKEKALASDHRRLVKSTREYTKKDGTVILLDSSWEEALARRLDELNINWVRPGPIKWIDDTGTSHNYFPDFYLTDYDLYLDPKNPMARLNQKKKLDVLTKTITNLIIIKTLDECKQFSL